MFCKYCGETIPEDSFFCEKCGKKVEKITISEKSLKAPKPPKRNIKIIVTLSIVLPLIAIGIIVLIVGGANYSSGKNLYKQGDYLNAAFKYRTAQKALFPNSGDLVALSLEEYSNSIINDIDNGQLNIARENLDKLKSNFPGYDSIEYLENKYFVNQNLLLAKEEIDNENYDNAILKLEEVLNIDPGNSEANELYNEINEIRIIESKVLSYEKDINHIYELYDDDNYREAYSEIKELIDDPEFITIMSETIYNDIIELKDRIYKDYKDVIDEDTKTATFHLEGDELSSGKGIVGGGGSISIPVSTVLNEPIFYFKFSTVAHVPEKKDQQLIVSINIYETSERDNSSNEVDLFLLSSNNLINPETGESIALELKNEYRGALVEIAQKGGKYKINKYGETFDIVIDSLIISEYWYDDLTITISMQ